MAVNKRAVAVHEAGHAVVAWILGHRVSSIRLYAEGNRDGTGGTTQYRKQPYTDRALQMIYEASQDCPDIAAAIDIVVSYAGLLAEMLFLEDEAARLHAIDVGASSDRANIARLLVTMNCPDKEIDRRIELLHELSSTYVSRHSKHVADLARALLSNGRIVKAKEIRQILGPRTMPLRMAIEDVRLALR